jgi:hypothetical protein
MANRRKPVSRLDPQARHDQAFQVPRQDQMADPAVLKASLIAKTGPTGEPLSPAPFDPIASAMSRHPGLTAEEALDFAKSFGF